MAQIEKEPEYVMDVIVIDEPTAGKYAESLQKALNDGYKPTSSIFVAMAAAGSKSGITEPHKCFVKELQKPLENPKFIAPKVNCIECEKEMDYKEWKTNGQICGECRGKGES